MASLGRPGVYLQESTVQQTTALTARTDAIAAFVGSTARGPISPGIVSSWSDFVKAYGGLDYNYPTTIAAYMFFSNGGRDAYVRRVVSTDSATSTRTLKQADGSTDAVTVKAVNPGSWGNALSVQITASDAVTKKFSIAVFGAPLTISGGTGTSNLLEQFNDLSLDTSSSRYALAIVNTFSNYISLTAISGNTTFVPPAYSSSTVALTGGSDGSAIVGSDITLSLYDFDVINAPLLFNAPDIATLAGASATKAGALSAQAALLRYAEARGDGFVIVDTPSGLSAFDAQVYATDVYNAATAAASTVSSFTVTAATPGYSGATVTPGSVTYTTGTTPHSFIVGNTVTLAGITNSATLSVPSAVTYTTGNVAGTLGQNYITLTGGTPSSITKGAVITGTAVGSGVGIPTGTTVTKVDGQLVYLSANVNTTFSAGTAIFTASASTIVKVGYQDVTQVTGYVTVITAAAHGFKNGDTVTLSGITSSISNAYNVPATITVIDSTSFYFASASTATVSGVSGTAVSQGYSGKFTVTAVPTTTTFVTSNTETGTAVLSSATASVTGTWNTGTASGANAAIYYPWLAIPDTSKSVPGVTKNVAPGGAILGVYQDTDASRGVFKSPAGYAATINVAVDLEYDAAGKPRRLTNEQLDTLNTATYPVNPVRVAPGAGIVVMGARTLNNVSPNRYINMRRSMIYIKKQIELRSQFAVFENNDEYLWRQLRSSLSNFLNMYWQQGGLRGTTPEQAFYVKCDGTTTGDSDIANGQVNIQVGVALEYPAEFVVINIGQLTGSATAF